jgi:hypothetical protein
LSIEFVDPTWERRLARLQARVGVTESEFGAEAHHNDRELPLVRNRADVIVARDSDGQEAPPAVVDHVVPLLLSLKDEPPSPINRRGLLG